MSDRESRSKPKKTVIGSFLGRLSRSKSRGVDIDRKKDANQHEVAKIVPSSKSDGNIKSVSDRRSSETSHRETSEAFLAEEARMSPARRLLNRFTTFRSTGRFKSASRSSKDASSDCLNTSRSSLTAKTTSEHDLHAITSSKPNRILVSSGIPTGAQSETDLRFVTSRDSHKSVPLNEPFGFNEKSPRAFMSENDLSSAITDFPEVNRTPSYLRISCALNGYTRSPKADLTPKAPMVMGESIVERRSKMFNHPQERKPAPGFGSPLTTTKSSESKTSEIECLTPIPPQHNNRLNSLLQNEMGNHVSTPQPIRDLISKFDQLDLCSAHKNEKDGVENIEPHKFIINQQPVFDEIDLKKDANGNDEEKSVEESNLKISTTDAESDSGISGSSPASSKRNVEILKDTKEDEQEVTTSTPSDAHEFRRLHDKVKADLKAKMDVASKDLEHADDFPEKCQESLRAAHGNAHLLVRKKFSKFNELIEKNINPIADDPMPVTVQDLEGFWMTIDMELKGIMKEFTKVEKYRAANWDPSAVEEEVDVADTTVKTTKPRLLITKKVTPIVSEETKKKLAEQKALAEQRRAEMRAQMRQKMKAKNQEEPVLGASEEC